jgi:acetylornithine deacetylase/succinyl-diaminopimelate desuccinylase-like protein
MKRSLPRLPAALRVSARPRLPAAVSMMLALAACVSATHAQSIPPVGAAATQAMQRIASQAPVKAALAAIERDDALTLKDQIELNEIEAPPFKEHKRAAEFLRRLQALGLSDARIDAEGNVVGVRRGAGKGPRLVVSAHLDTVFPEGTDVKVRQKDGRYYAPGIYDDARGLATVLQVLRTLNEARIETVGDVLFVGTVGEEELGDLRGVKALFRDDRHIDGFISVDGVAVWRVVYAATGSRRYKVAFVGPGGHSFAAFGLPSATHAMGRAIAKIGEVRTPSSPKTTFTVGTVTGGTSVNAIAAFAELGLDMRSDSAEELKKLESTILPLMQQAADEENRRWDAKPEQQVKVEMKLVGDRPAGAQPYSSPVVEAARAALATMGLEAKSIAASSTDSNLPIALGIPAATLGGGGQGAGSHAPGEWYQPVNAWQGPQKLLLTVLGLVGVRGTSAPLLPVRAPR